MRQTRDSRQEELGNNTVQPALEPGSRGLPIARGVDTINQFGYPRVSEEGRVRRNLVMTEGNSPQPGLWSFALPGIIQASTAAPELHALDNNGRADPNHKPFPRWQLPDGTKDVAPGTTGIIVAGTDLDEDRVIFHPDAAVGLRVNHLGTKRPAGESIVFGTDEFDQLDGDGGLSSAFYVVALPPQMGSRYVISLNAMSLEDKNLDGNMAFVFNKVGQYAGQLGERIVGMGVWNRNGPFAADPTNATELGRNNRQIPFRAIMLDYRTAKFGNPEQQTDAPAPLDFDDSRYAFDTVPVGWRVSGGHLGAGGGVVGGVHLQPPFFGKGRLFLNPNRRNTQFDVNGQPTQGYGVWEIEVEEHMIAPQTSGGSPQGQFGGGGAPSAGGGGGGGGGGRGGGGGPGGGGGGPGGRGGDKKGDPDPDNKEPRPKPRGDHDDLDDNRRKKKCRQQPGRDGPRIAGGGNRDEAPDIGPRPDGVSPSVWRRIQSLLERLAKAKRRGQPKRAARLAEALAKLKEKAQRQAKDAQERANKRARLKEYGHTNPGAQARIAARRAVAAEIARRRAACEPRMGVKERQDLRRQAEEEARDAISGGSAGGGGGGGAAKKPGVGRPEDAPKGTASSKVDAGLLEKVKDSVKKELDRREAAEKREAEAKAGSSKAKRLKEIEDEYRRRRKAIDDAKTAEELRGALAKQTEEAARRKANQSTDGPITGARAERDSHARRSAPAGSILPAMMLDKLMLPALDFYAVTDKHRRENTLAAADSRTIQEYIEQGKAPASICITPMAGIAIEPRQIKNIAVVSSFVFHGPDVDPASEDASNVTAGVVLRPESPLYIGARPVEGQDADNYGPAVDGWRLKRGTNSVDASDALEVECLDDTGAHDDAKTVEFKNTVYAPNGQVYPEGPHWKKATVSYTDINDPGTLLDYDVAVVPAGYEIIAFIAKATLEWDGMASLTVQVGKSGGGADDFVEELELIGTPLPLSRYAPLAAPVLDLEATTGIVARFTASDSMDGLISGELEVWYKIQKVVAQ